MFTVSKAGDGFRLAGELDLDTVDELLAAVRPAVGQGCVRLDVRELTFMDSQGIRALLEIRKSLDGGNVVLVAPCDGVRQVLEITGLVQAGAVRLEPG
jgi:anti-anti-sigma factor